MAQAALSLDRASHKAAPAEVDLSLFEGAHIT